MTDTPRKDGPRTVTEKRLREAAFAMVGNWNSQRHRRALLEAAELDRPFAPDYTMEDVAEAAAGPREIERERVEQAFIDGSVEGSPIDHDGNRRAAAGPRDDGLLREALDILERTHPSDPDNSPVFWDGWHAALAAVRVALAATTGAAPSESEERS